MLSPSRDRDFRLAPKPFPKQALTLSSRRERISPPTPAPSPPSPNLSTQASSHEPTLASSRCGKFGFSLPSRSLASVSPRFASSPASRFECIRLSIRASSPCATPQLCRFCSWAFSQPSIQVSNVWKNKVRKSLWWKLTLNYLVFAPLLDLLDLPILNLFRNPILFLLYLPFLNFFDLSEDFKISKIIW